MAFAVSLGIQSWIESGVIAGALVSELQTNTPPDPNSRPPLPFPAVIIANIGVGFFQCVPLPLESACVQGALRSYR